MGSSRSAPSAPDVRVARGWLLAASAVVLTLTAHTAADGALPDPALALAIAGLVGWASTAVRTARLPVLLAILAAAQLVIHFALTFLAPHGSHVAAVDDTTMLAAHAVATVVLAALIGSAERGLIAVVAGLRRLLPVVFAAGPHPAGQVPAVVVPAAAGTHTEVLLRRVHTRRGPPR